MMFTPSTIVALLLPLLTLLLICSLVGRQLLTLRRQSAHPYHPLDWADDPSVERYRPMFRLLDDEDFQFLRQQPGVTPALVSRLRQQRYLVFRGYLRSLENDFRRTSDALLLALIQSRTDRADLVAALMAAQARFSLNLLLLRCRMVIFRWNFSQKRLAHLMTLFEEMQNRLRAIAPAAHTARCY